jgi:hypothetical protein
MIRGGGTRQHHCAPTMSLLMTRRRRRRPLLLVDARRHMQHVSTTSTASVFLDTVANSRPDSSLLTTTTTSITTIRRRYFTPEAYRYKRHPNDNNNKSSSTTNKKSHHPNGLKPRKSAEPKQQQQSLSSHPPPPRHHHQQQRHTKHNKHPLSKEQLRNLQKECYRLILTYHATLFPDDIATADINEQQSTTISGAADLLQVLHQLHEQCDKKQVPSENSSTVSLQTLYQTEEVFRHICKLLDRCNSSIALGKWKGSPTCSVEPNDMPSMVAEKFLDCLVELRTDRARLIEMATTQQQQEASQRGGAAILSGLTSWIRDVFVSGEQHEQEEAQENSKQQQQELVAHKDPSFGPSASTINSAITTIYHEVSDDLLSKLDKDADEPQDDEADDNVGLSPEQMLDRANRLSRLLETMRQLNLQPKALTLGLVLKAHEAIGTLEAALKAEKLYSYFPEEGAFSPLLYAFRDAALYEQSQTKRGEAAKRAHDLVLKREETVEGAKRVATHYKILLQAYANAGNSIVPDVCERAESLLQRLVGTKAFLSVVNFDPDSPVSVHEFNPALLHSLIVIYADSGDKDKIERAMNVLRYMENARDHSGRTIKDRPKFHPNVDTYNAVLKALKYHPQRTKYGRDLVERMTRNVASWPNQRTFQEVRLDVDDSPEEWLSMLETRRLCLLPTGRDDLEMDTSVYHWALGRFRYKARDSGGVEAARRGVRLVDSMEAQSGVADLSISSLSNMSGFEQDVASSVYNAKLRPTVETYNLILAACNFVTVESDKEEAFTIANDMYRRIVERGLSPDKTTYKLYLWCCTNLAQSSESRKAQVEQVAKHALKTKQIPKGLGSVLHQNNLPHLLKELNEKAVSSR